MLDLNFMHSTLQLTQIERHVGQTSFENGRSYFMSGRVMRFGRSGMILKGLVLGSQPHPYETMVWLNPEGIEESTCSCPVGAACKHVAAVAFREVMGKAAAAAAPAAPVKTPAKAGRSGAGWALAMSGWTGEASQEPRARLGLILRVRADDYEWRTPSTRGRAKLQLQIRPMTYYPVSNRVSLSDISWKTYLGQSSYTASKGLLNEAQTWFMFQLAKALTLREGFYAWNDTWLAVDHGNARFVWDVLSRAASAGVILRSDGKNGEAVQLDPAVSFAARAVVEDVRNGVTVRNTIWLGDAPAPEAMLFGSPAVFGAVISSPGASVPSAGDLDPVPPRIISLHPSAPIPAAVGPAILIPEEDMNVFAEKFLPKLSRSSAVENRSAKVTLPVHLPPRAVVEVGPSKNNGISAGIVWQYGRQRTPVNSKSPALTDEAGQRIARDPDTEARILTAIRDQIASFGSRYLEPAGLLTEGKRIELKGDTAAGLVTAVLPTLSSIPDVEVHTAPGTPALFELTEPRAEFTLHEESQETAARPGDWFDLRINVVIDGQTVAFDKCFEAISRKEHYLFLPDGRFVSLDHPFFNRLRDLIRQASHLRDAATGNIRLTRFQAGWWEELIKLGVVREQAQSWKDSAGALLDFRNVPVVPQPENFKGTLRHYQAEGYSWMSFLRDKNLGGVLADDMGLGKTVQTICLACQGRTPFLIVAPTSVVENWDMELERFAPHLKRTVMRRGDRSLAHRTMKESDVIVTSYALFQRDEEHFAAVEWDTAVFDEAQFLKNHLSKSYGAIRRLKARSKFALTGTPLENNLMELWSIFSITAPGLFPTPEKFKELFQKPIEKQSDPKALETLRAQIRPFLLRRLKENVEKELPPKTEQSWVLEMSPKQEHVYQVHLQKERQKVLGLLDREGGLKANRFKILTSLMRLRQLCLHAALVDRKYAKVPSAKLDELTDRLETILAEKHRVVIFSQFTSFLALVKKRLDKQKWKYAYLDGATTDRKEALDRFRKDEDIPIFLISLKAGGVGLNLTAADYCILLDPWWNPAVESQAVDRTHRIGQTRHVMVYRLIVRGTIEEKVVQLQGKKRQLFRNVLDQGDIFSNLVTEADIRKIFD
jgi:superfamily II DNA or RNA helicase